MFEMCLICGADTNELFRLRGWTQRILKKIFKQIMDMFHEWSTDNVKTFCWNSALGIYLGCWYELIVHDHLRNSVGATQWIQLKITGRLRERIRVQNTGYVKKSAGKFENWKQRLLITLTVVLTSALVRHNVRTRSLSIHDRSSDVSCKTQWKLVPKTESSDPNVRK